MTVYGIENNIGYGPHRDLSHISNKSRFNFYHRHSSMETRLTQTKHVGQVKKGQVTYQHGNEGDKNILDIAYFFECKTANHLQNERAMQT